MRLSFRTVVFAAVFLLTGLAAVSCQDSGEEAAPGGIEGGGITSPDASVPEGYQGTGVSQSEVLMHVDRLSHDDMNGRDEGTPESAQARAYIIEQLTACNVLPAGVSGFEQKITTGKGTNILGVIPGKNPELAARHVLISAHYDHLSPSQCGGKICNGANDNAAAVANVLGVACALSRTKVDRSILVALWDAEEPPTFLTNKMGSAFYVANPTVPLAQIDVALVLDLVGSELWPGTGGHFWMGAESSSVVASVVDATPRPEGLSAHRGGLHLVEQTPTGYQPWSDYDGFRNAKVPALFISDGQNKKYHTAGDDMSNLNLDKLFKEASFMLDVVTRLGNLATTPTYEASQHYTMDAATTVAVLEMAVAPGGLVDALGKSSSVRSKLQADLTAARAVKTSLESGKAATNAQVETVRTGIQRVMCYSGNAHAEFFCNIM